MHTRYAAALALALGTLSACQDSSIAAPSDGVATVIHPRDYAAYDITPLVPPTLPPDEDPLAPATMSYQYESLDAYNGIINGQDQLQLISYQNAYSGVTSHTLSTQFLEQPGCSGTYQVKSGESFTTSGAGLSSQRTLTWPASSVVRGEVRATHTFTDGVNTVSLPSSDGYCV